MEKAFIINLIIILSVLCISISKWTEKEDAKIIWIVIGSFAALSFEFSMFVYFLITYYPKDR